MKTITIIALLMISLLSTAQFGISLQKKEQFLISTHVDVGASIEENGMNQVLEFEYTGAFGYVKGGFEYFLGTPVTDYYEWHSAFGFNIVSGYNELFRFYSGIRLGRIYRPDYGEAAFYGFELGGTIKLNNNLRLGLRATTDKRFDQDLLNDPIFWRNSGFITMTWTVKNLR